jgi:hypothetical protein
VLSLDPGFAVGVYVDVEGHRVAADRAVLDVVLVRPPGNIDRHDDLFAARVADIRGFELCYGLSTAAFGTFLSHGSQNCSPFARWRMTPPRSMFLGRFTETILH